jgi:hypothetical protein
MISSVLSEFCAIVFVAKISLFASVKSLTYFKLMFNKEVWSLGYSRNQQGASANKISTEDLLRRKIRLTESNAKCRYLRPVKILCGRCFICLRPPYSPPLTHCICVYSILIHTGKGEGGANQREVKRGNSSQSRSKIPTWLTASPVYNAIVSPRADLKVINS